MPWDRKPLQKMLEALLPWFRQSGCGADQPLRGEGEVAVVHAQPPSPVSDATDPEPEPCDTSEAYRTQQRDTELSRDLQLEDASFSHFGLSLIDSI